MDSAAPAEVDFKAIKLPTDVKQTSFELSPLLKHASMDHH
jgi:hypothetical protein